MFYTFDDLEYNARANALYELWDGLMDYDDTEEGLSVLRTSVQTNLTPLISYFQDNFNTRITVDGNVAWKLACNIRFPDEEEVEGFAGLENCSMYKFPVDVDIEAWMDEATREAFAAGVPVNDVEIFFELPTAEAIGLEEDRFVDELNSEADKTYDFLDDFTSSRMSYGALVSFAEDDISDFVSAAASFFLAEHVEEVINDIILWLEPQLAALGPVFDEDGYRCD